MPARSIMIQGTGSNVGKSIVTAALCRIFSQDGYRSAPFKSQNMALNSFVTKDGLEMGRAQVVQAEAAGIDPTVEMNPILLKPTGDSKSQVVVMGKPFRNMSAMEYYADRDKFLQIIKDAYDVLKNNFDIIVIEGAGSPAEINIKDRDIVNMKMAEIADAPVLLVTDIDRGGSFAWIVGTLQLLSRLERERIEGVIFNKFRGDIRILMPGYKMLEDIINKPVLGTIPYIDNIQVDNEDSVSLEYHKDSASSNQQSAIGNQQLDIVVIKLQRISNFTDFDPLVREHGVSLRYVKETHEIGNPDLIIIPGTKGTINDLKQMIKNGIANTVVERVNNGCMIIGICGGYQMMGMEIRDPLHVESDDETIKGLGLINAVTEFALVKETHQSRARVIPGSLPFEVEQELKGYEIHMGITKLLDFGNRNISDGGGSSFLKIIERSTNSVNIDDGAVVFDGKRFVIGTYLHGIFDNDSFRSGLLNYLAKKRGKWLINDKRRIESAKEKLEGYKRLEAITRKSLNMEYIYKIIKRK